MTVDEEDKVRIEMTDKKKQRKADDAEMAPAEAASAPAASSSSSSAAAAPSVLAQRLSLKAATVGRDDDQKRVKLDTGMEVEPLAEATLA